MTRAPEALHEGRSYRDWPGGSRARRAILARATILLLLPSSPLLAHPLKVGFADISIREKEVDREPLGMEKLEPVGRVELSAALRS